MSYSFMTFDTIFLLFRAANRMRGRARRILSVSKTLTKLYFLYIIIILQKGEFL
jgi:hypothetical protein